MELLSKVITGKATTPIGTFIQFLKAGDWVKKGLALSEKSNGKCPYCQRDLPEDIAKQISDFFDEEYEKDCAAIIDFFQIYSAFFKSVKMKMEDIAKNRYAFLKYDEFDLLTYRFETVSEQNLRLIQTKIDNPSETITISPISCEVKQLNEAIACFNEKIINRNNIIENQQKAQVECQKMVWDFFINQLHETLTKYQKESDGLNRGIQKLEDKIRTNERNIQEIESKIHEKESEMTSVLPTVTAINNILEKFGFTGFSLAENIEKPGTYIIIRSDGSDAGATLSEGEHNFITFLYFYHLCFGSQTNTGITDDKIIVIDDPISSLDSNILFIVATLVKSVIQNCIKKEKGIKQIFILTHNVYFHKEITYLGSRKTFSPNYAAYFTIRKKDEQSMIVFSSDNPIKTSYEILWNEIRNPNDYSTKSVFNTMRRILEHYFQIIGGIRYEECIDYFDGEDKLLCKALIAVINDGSHSVFEDFVVSFDETTLEKYLKVFKSIFEHLHHIDHYNMMMRTPTLH